MSSASKGRYQSRLFNFFHKQSRRFGEGFGRSLRQLQVATSWSLEALSKSIYLLLQKAADSAGTQLPGTARESWLQLQSSEELSSDSAIVKIIENVEKRYISSQEDSQLSFSTNTKNKLTASGYSGARIQGVASQLCSQSLVLVTSENEILDILTVSQQQVLENKIISEVANYWRFWRLSQESQDKKLSKRKNSFLKRLGSGYSRVQKALAGVKGEGRFHKYLQINPATIASLDTAVANLETNALVPVSSAGIVVKQRGGRLIQTVRQKLDIFLYGNREVRVNKVEVVVDGNLETQKSKIKALISAALQYFYGDSKNNQVKQVHPEVIVLLFL